MEYHTDKMNIHGNDDKIHIKTIAEYYLFHANKQ